MRIKMIKNKVLKTYFFSPLYMNISTLRFVTWLSSTIQKKNQKKCIVMHSRKQNQSEKIKPTICSRRCCLQITVVIWQFYIWEYYQTADMNWWKNKTLCIIFDSVASSYANNDLEKLQNRVPATSQIICLISTYL